VAKQDDGKAAAAAGVRRVLVAYGSETGQAEKVATQLSALLCAAGLEPSLEAADDVEVPASELPFITRYKNSEIAT
jgi:flavodoxin